MHRLLIEHLRDLLHPTSMAPAGVESPRPLMVEGDEARHALSVKRLRPGEAVELFDGEGLVARATVAELSAAHKKAKHGCLHLEVGEVRTIPSIRPSVTVCTATPKGQRVDEMVDGLSQAGAAAWRPMRTARGVVDPREAKLERLGRISRESAKQCGRVWVMRIEPELDLATALAACPTTIVADASGESLMSDAVRRHLHGVESVGLLVGPEGGFTPEELTLARECGAIIASFGPHVMRIETAAVIGAAMVIEAARFLS